MLYLSRKLGESIIINHDITLKVMEIKGRSVKIGFEFPPSASVLRKEIFDAIQSQNIAASQESNALGLDDLLGAIDEHRQTQDSPEDQGGPNHDE
jgi:carbon storage regulator